MPSEQEEISLNFNADSTIRGRARLGAAPQKSHERWGFSP
jgi:hypothetical protein